MRAGSAGAPGGPHRAGFTRAGRLARDLHRTVGRVRRKQRIRELPITQLGVHAHPEDLGIEVASEVPGLDLRPGRGVERRPWLWVIPAHAAALAEHEAFQHERELE